jgi:hypothetical protein
MEIPMYLTFVDGSRISEPSLFSLSRWNLIALFMRERVSFRVAPDTYSPAFFLSAPRKKS